MTRERSRPSLHAQKIKECNWKQLGYSNGTLLPSKLQRQDESFHGITGGGRVTAHLWGGQILAQDHRTVQHATLSNDWTSGHKDHEASTLCLDTCQTVSQLQNSGNENKERKLPSLLCQHLEHSKALPRSYLFPPDHVEESRNSMAKTQPKLSKSSLHKLPRPPQGWDLNNNPTNTNIQLIFWRSLSKHS